MPRGIRNEAPLKLPEGVKLAKWVPLIIVPRSPSNKQQRRAEGVDLATSRRQQTDPHAGQPLTFRYQPCCETHKAQMTLTALESPQQLMARCQSLAKDQGHIDLMPREAKLDWMACEDKMPCEDCLAALPADVRKDWERSRAA